MDKVKLSINPIAYQIMIPIGGIGTLIIIIILSIIGGTIRPLATAFITLGLVIPALPFIKAKKVVYIDENIIVSDFSKKEKIPVENIEEILILGSGRYMMVQIELKNESIHFGKTIKYAPKEEIPIPYDKERGIYLAPGNVDRKIFTSANIILLKLGSFLVFKVLFTFRSWFRGILSPFSVPNFSNIRALAVII